MLEGIGRPIGAGYAVQLLKERSKAPFHSKWSTRPVATLDELKRDYRPGMNIGVRTGKWSRSPTGQYLHIIDFDIRDPSAEDEAWAALDRMFPDHERWPAVRSGSGLGRHFHVGTGRPYTYKVFAISPDTFTDPKTGKVADRWKIEFYGTGKQVVLPPSIHPDTGKPYTWIREPKWHLAAMGEDVLPHISGDLIEELGGKDDRREDDESDRPAPDSLEEMVRQRPLGWSIDKIEDLVDDLPFEWADKYPLWLKVGAALEHEFDGGQDGLDIWHWFSKRSDKYDPKVLDKKWESFGKNPRPVTLKSLIGPAKEARFNREYRDDEGDDDDGDRRDGDDPDDWKSQLDTDQEGRIKKTLPNYVLILKNDPRTAGKIAYNEFTDEIVYREEIDLGVPGSVVLKPRDRINGSSLKDVGYAMLRALFEAKRRRGKDNADITGWGLPITDRDLKAAVETAALANSFNPVKEFIEAEKWDGVERIEEIFIHFMGCPDDIYHRAVAKYMMLGAVTRVYEPGHKFDFVPIIEGAQGIAKSSFVEKLAGHWFAELHADFDDQKRLVETMLGSWILEIPELSQFNKSQVRDIKAFLSGKSDKVRLSYRRDAERFYRSNIFVGTTNDYVYLSDNTGHRRFWSIKAERAINIDEFEDIVPQLWAEALNRYREMRRKQPRGTLPLYLSDREIAAEAKKQSEMRELDSQDKSLAGQLTEWLNGKSSGRFEEKPHRITCVADVWENYMENAKSRIAPKSERDMIARALDMIPEFERIGMGRMPGFGLQKCWRRKSEAKPVIRKRPVKKASDLI